MSQKCYENIKCLSEAVIKFHTLLKSVKGDVVNDEALRLEMAHYTPLMDDLFIEQKSIFDECLS